MKLAELQKNVGGYRFSLLLITIMLAMVFFGYQLAGYQHKQNTLAYENATTTAQMLKAENDILNLRVSRLEVELALEKNVTSAAHQQRQEAISTVRRLEEQLAFYQNVMAPELTQDGFLVDGLQVVAAASERFYRLSLVLLQQRQNKAIVKGDLFIRIKGSQDGKPAVIEPGQPQFLPEGPVVYRFKYFQTVNVSFQLPENFVPEFIEFASEVYQYTTKRGDYMRRFPWSQVFDEQPESTDTVPAHN